MPNCSLQDGDLSFEEELSAAPKSEISNHVDKMFAWWSYCGVPGQHRKDEGE